MGVRCWVLSHIIQGPHLNLAICIYSSEDIRVYREVSFVRFLGIHSAQTQHFHIPSISFSLRQQYKILSDAYKNPFRLFILLRVTKFSSHMMCVCVCVCAKGWRKDSKIKQTWILPLWVLILAVAYTWGWEIWEMGVPPLRGSPSGLEMGGGRLNCHITARPMDFQDSMHPSTFQVIVRTKE